MFGDATFDVDWANRVEDSWAIVLIVWNAVAVDIVGVGEIAVGTVAFGAVEGRHLGCRVFGARAHRNAGRFFRGLVAIERFIFIAFLNIFERLRGAGCLRINFLCNAAEVEAFGAAVFDDVGIAIDEFTVEDNGRDIFERGIDNRAMGIVVRFFINGDIGDIARFEVASNIGISESECDVINK